MTYLELCDDIELTKENVKALIRNITIRLNGEGEERG